MTTRQAPSNCSARDRRGVLLAALLLTAPGVLLMTTVRAHGRGPSKDAPFVDAKAVRERFDTITSEDMDLLRSKKILFLSRSFGLNIRAGLNQLAKEDKKYEMLSSYERFDVRTGGGVGAIPPDIFKSKNFVHFLASAWPPTKRFEELVALMREPPHRFGNVVDVVVVMPDTTTSPKDFEASVTPLDDLRADFPKTHIIYMTAGVQGKKWEEQNEKSHAFSELVRQRYKGKVPLYDIEAVLSDDFRVGHMYCPEYSKDPAEVHPNLPAGEIAMAKGFLLILRDAIRQDSRARAASSRKDEGSDKKRAATLPANHPDVVAVRAILDANGLTKLPFEDVAEVQDGRVVKLVLNEVGITHLPDAIGKLTSLRSLFLYGDPKQPYPLLKSISPEIGKCVELRELLINQNDLESLPVEIASLRKLTRLSLAHNRLHDLAPEVLTWARKLDPQGLQMQAKTSPD